MPRRPVSLIAACSLNRVIGRRGALPWLLPADWAFFTTATRRQILILGRRSFEELTEPLANRHTIVVSPSRARQPTDPLGVVVVASLDEALALAQSEATYAEATRVFVGGGERLYGEALERGLVQSCYVTRVHTRIEDGDAFLPEWTKWCPRLDYAASTTSQNTRITFNIWSRDD